MALSLSGREHTTSQSERIKQGNQRTNVTRNCKSFSILSQRWDSCAIKAFDDIFFVRVQLGGEKLNDMKSLMNALSYAAESGAHSKRAGTLLTLRNDFNLWCDGRRETMETARYDPKILGKYLSSLFHVSLLPQASMLIELWQKRNFSTHKTHIQSAINPFQFIINDENNWMRVLPERGRVFSVSRSKELSISNSRDRVELSWEKKKKVQKWIIDFNSPNSQRTSESAQTLLSTDKQKHQAEENRRKMTIIHNLLVRKNCLALLIIILSTFNSLLLSENASILLPQASTTAQTTPHACADDFSPTKKAHP